MRKYLAAIALAAVLTACAGVTLQSVIDAIVTNAKVECGVAVNAADLAVALSGQNPAIIIAANIAHSVCSQYLAQVPPTPAGAPKATASADVTVEVNGHRVHVSK